MTWRKAIFLLSFRACFCLILLVKVLFSVVLDVTQCVRAIRENIMRLSKIKCMLILSPLLRTQRQNIPKKS